MPFSLLKHCLVKLLTLPLDNRSAFLAAFVIICVAAWLLQRRTNRAKKPAPHRFSDSATCLKILQNLPYDDCLGTNKLSHEVSRAIPNQRLVRAFQIDNGFTTSDAVYGRQFKRKAVWTIRQVTSTARGGWNQIATVAREIATTYFRKSMSDDRADLDLIVQVVTLKTVLSMFFELDATTYTDATAFEIAQMINLLWMQSKSTTGHQSADFSSLKSLLQGIGLDWTDSKENPLNILLPAYETLWRVVARCLIEVVFRPSADADWRPLLETFIANPTTGTFSKIAPGETNVSVEFLVNEALRLYPPTRRIYRHVHFHDDKQMPELLAADIEASHRQLHIWGDDSHRYRPARWIAADQKMRDAFMPFGGGDWICPASSGFGAMMIGVLVATFAEIISAYDWELRLRGEEGSDEGSRILDDETELDSDRRENTAWDLVRRS
ncbi:MAG: hypothetical protein LQ339_005197 [Xanthoria mediterranea]|nr:MAG: hypothetical protein LQ339_005197 [Xanthoria mediterranea]